MNITGHRSVEAVRKYKVPNDQQKMNTLQQLISNYNIQDQESPIQKQPLQVSQITNQDLRVNMASNKEKIPMFSECHFQNVFYFN